MSLRSVRSSFLCSRFVVIFFKCHVTLTVCRTVGQSVASLLCDQMAIIGDLIRPG